MGKQSKKVATGKKVQVKKPVRRSSRTVEVSKVAEKTRGKREDAEEEESWIAKLLAATANSAPAAPMASTPVSVGDFKHLKKTAGYFEALAQARLLTDEQMPRLRAERGKAMQRTLAQINKEVVYVNGDGSCALYAILRGVGITVAPADDKARRRFQDYEIVRDSIRGELALVAEDTYPEVAGSLRDVGEWLEVEDIHFIAKALGITVMLLMGARAKENDYAFRCVDQGVVNPEGRQATITLLLYEDHYYPVFSRISTLS